MATFTAFWELSLEGLTNFPREVASVGRALNLPVTVVVPRTTTELMINRIRGENAEVIVHGANWNEADLRVQEMMESNPS